MIARRAAIVALLTIVAIVVHESGHFLVYRLGGCPVVITLQSVRPVGSVDASLDQWARVAGPALSLMAAGLFLQVARLRPGFAWATASFTNASLRLFPLAMDVLRAVKHAPAFSDEGEVALAITGVPWGRLALLAVPIGAAVLLSVLAAREYHFARRAVPKVMAIYILSLAVGIGIVIADELTR